MKQRVFKGEITVFLSLVFVLLISFVGSMIQSASIHINKSMKRADTELALESVFAEYNSEMLEEYDLFARVGRDSTQISRRLWFYGAKNMEHQIQKMQLLTDAKGQAFYEQTIRAMGGEVESVQDVSEETCEPEEKQVTQELEDLLQEEEQELPTENNPIESINQLKKSSLLSLIVSSPENISNRYVALEELPSKRTLYTGTEHFSKSEKGGLTEKLLFTAYLMEKFPDYTQNSTKHSLFYEAEYLIGGKSSDQENLEAVAKKILTIRMASNYSYLLTSTSKQAEVEALAATLCSLLTVPGATTIVKHAILFAWAYGESILDLRVLLKGESVALLKTDETWQLQLENITKLGTAEEVNEEKGIEDGMSYEDYLKALLYVEDTESLCMRALDLIELNLGIRVDGCVTALEIKSTCKLQRGITDTFLTDYQYQ